MDSKWVCKRVIFTSPFANRPLENDHNNGRNLYLRGILRRRIFTRRRLIHLSWFTRLRQPIRLRRMSRPQYKFGWWVGEPLRKWRVLINDLIPLSIIRKSMESSVEIFDTHQEAIFLFGVVLSLVCSVRDSHLMERRTVPSHLWNKEEQVSLKEYTSHWQRSIY